MSSCYCGLNDPFHSLPLLMTEWSILLHCYWRQNDHFSCTLLLTTEEIIHFAKYDTAAKTLNAFQWPRQFPKVVRSHGGIYTSHQIHGSLGPHKFTLQSASRSVQPFLQVSQMWPKDKKTETQTKPATYL